MGTTALAKAAWVVAIWIVAALVVSPRAFGSSGFDAVRAALRPEQVQDLVWAHPSVPFEAIAHLAVDGAGVVWVRTSMDASGLTRVAALDPGDAHWLFVGTLRGAVEWVAVRAGVGGAAKLATLKDFWSVDSAGRTWVGPAYYDGKRWTDLAPRGRSADGPLWQDSVVLDAKGEAWVPFSTCTSTEGCVAEGLRAFNSRGQLDLGIAFEPVPEAGRYGVGALHLLPAGTDASGAMHGPWAVTRRALYVLPETTAVDYPLLEAGAGQSATRNAGYATAALQPSAATPLAVTWVEVQADRALSYHVMGNLRRAGTWASPEDLSGGALFPEGVKEDRILAAEIGRFLDREAMWVGTAAGRVGTWDGTGWDRVFERKETGLGPNTRITAMAVQSDRVWVGTTGGVFTLGRAGTLGGAGKRSFLPAVRRGLR